MVGLRQKDAGSDDPKSAVIWADNFSAIPTNKTTGIIASRIRETVAAGLHPYVIA